MNQPTSNGYQVGGTHYKGDVQHWDMVIYALRNRYLEGNATKYICRHSKKNGLQDLQKAKHYVCKLIENVNTLHSLGQDSTRENVLLQFFLSQRLDVTEMRACYKIATWNSVDDLQDCMALIDELCSHYGTEPTTAYVNQG